MEFQIHVAEHGLGKYDEPMNQLSDSLDDPIMAQCPACRMPMKLVVERDVNIDRCEHCKGVWLDSGELERLSKSKDFRDREITAGELSDLKCPRCSKQEFVSIHTNAGTIARCAECGGMFVGGETLAHVAEYDQSRLPKNQTVETIAMSVEAISDILNWLAFFSHH